ncbi:MAG: glycosyltransferase family 39 protein [Planctomycetes bacterium]|nr:glycosyltransferase family 39 protein [Planctomycetota bacterium]
MTVPGPGKRTVHLLAALLLAGHLAVLVHTARETSETYDEPMYLLAGLSYWKTGDWSFNREHPPLPKLLIGAPLRAAGLELPPHYQMAPACQVSFLHETNGDARRTIYLGRLPMIALGLLLALLVFRIGCVYGGPWCGLLTLLAHLFQPVLTGNTPLAALDLATAFFAILALYAFGRLRQSPGPGRALAAGVALGLALLTKLTNVLLFPVMVALALVDAARQRSARPLGRLVLVGCVGLSTLYLGYGCEMRTLASVEQHPRYVGGAGQGKEAFTWPPLAAAARWFGERPIPLFSYLKGIDYLKAGSGKKGFRGYFRGEVSQGEGWRSYYLVSFLVKTPCGILLAFALSLMLLPFLARRPGLDGALFLFPLLILLWFSLMPAQKGFRYVLPALPAVAVMIGRLWSFDPTRCRRQLVFAAEAGLLVLPVLLLLAFPERGGLTAGAVLACAAPVTAGLVLVHAGLKATFEAARLRRVFRAVLLGLVVWGGLESLAAHPDYLMFFNQYAGGAERGWRITTLGDDWGQGLPALARMQRERGWPKLCYAAYGFPRPEVYGLDYRFWSGSAVSGLAAVHAANFTRQPEQYEILSGLEPIAQANGILVFEIPEARVTPPK